MMRIPELEPTSYEIRPTGVIHYQRNARELVLEMDFIGSASSEPVHHVLLELKITEKPSQTPLP